MLSCCEAAVIFSKTTPVLSFKIWYSIPTQKERQNRRCHSTAKWHLYRPVSRAMFQPKIKNEYREELPMEKTVLQKLFPDIRTREQVLKDI